jgi:hypothetical protein
MRLWSDVCVHDLSATAYDNEDMRYIFPTKIYGLLAITDQSVDSAERRCERVWDRQLRRDDEPEQTKADESNIV